MRSIILSRHDFREYDQIISVFAQDYGKQEFLARGVKKITSKNSPYLEPCSWVDLEVIQGQEINHLIRVQPINLFKNIRKDFLKSSMAYYLIRVTEQFLSGHEQDERIYELLLSWLKFLDTINQADNRGDVLIYGFFLKLFSILGFKPTLNQCVVAGEKLNNNEIYFSPSLGGVVCGWCRGLAAEKRHVLIPLSYNEKEELQHLLDATWSELKNKSLTVKEQNIIEQLGKYHTEKHFSSWNHFKMNTALQEER